MIDISVLQKAIKLGAEGKYEEAEQLYTELLEKYPDESALFAAAGLFNVSIKKYEKAVLYLKRACELKETLGSVAALGFVQFECKDYAGAASTLEHALKFGDNIDVYHKLILSLFEIRYYSKAIEYTDKMNELFPGTSKAVANKVKALTKTGQLMDAKHVCTEYLKKNPNDPVMWYHLGLLKELIYSDEKQAIECYKLAGENGDNSADYNIAVSYQKLGQYEKAEEYYKQYLQNHPENENAKISLGLCYLTQKRFKEGYDLLYQRTVGLAKNYTKNLWKPGTPLSDELVVICDQGLGDRIQFIRYLPFLAAEHKVKVAVSDNLIDLFRSNYPNIEFIDYKDIDPEMTALRVTDLAYVLNMDFDNIPTPEGYLDIEPAQIENEKLKVGLCWEAGASGLRGMINRTIHVKVFEKFLNLENIQPYSFQYDDTFKGNEKYPQMINLAHDFKNLSDTASALKSMDVVITVDTVIAHLAGALGVKTYLLLPYAPDWRWFWKGRDENGNTDYLTETPWYKSVRIFMQKDNISWDEPIDEIVELLKAGKTDL